MMSKLISATALALVLPMTASAAVIVIDDFATAQGPVMAGGGGTMSDSQATGSAIGGTRNISVTNIGGPGDTEAQTIGGVFGFSNDFLTFGTATLSYIAGGADLTDGGLNDTIVAAVDSIDLGMSVGLSIDGVSNAFVVNSVGDLEFSFSSFAGVDFTNVSDIALTFDTNGVPAVDASIVLLGAQDLEPNPVTPAPVPLPAAGWLLGGALLAGAGLRRRG